VSQIKQRKTQAGAKRRKRKPADNPHIIELGPIGATCLAFTRMIRRRGAWVREHIRKRVVAYGLPILALSLFMSWNTAPLREHDMTAPYKLANCETSRYADGILRRWGATDASSSCPVAVTQTLAWSSFTDALASECEMEPRMTRLEAWLRDRKTKSRTPKADPLPRPQGETIEVAYSEGTAP
jgi:hypothetical protein